MLGPLWFLLESFGEIPAGPRALGGVMWVLGWLPTVAYFATREARRPPIPVLPMIGVFFALYFPLQLLLGVANVNPLVSLNPTLDYLLPAQLALVGWIVLLLGNATMAATLPRRGAQILPRWSAGSLKRYAFGLLIGGLAIDLARMSLPLPAAVHGILTFLATLALLGAAILVVLGKRGHLNPLETTILWSVVVAMAIVQMGTGSVATFARTGVTLILAAWVAGARLRPSNLAGGLILAAIVITLRGFVIEYRLQAWWSGEDLSQSRRAALWWTLLSRHVEDHGAISTIGHATFVVATRFPTLDLYADVIHRTPAFVPFWEGRTYASLVGAFVPRVLWPDKPRKQVANEFGHRYSYLNREDRHTSINLPYLVELYVNFGESGVMIGMFAIGGLLAFLGWSLNQPGQDWVWSLGGIVLLVPIVTNFESDFSLVFGGLILNGFAFLLAYRFLAARCGSAVLREGAASAPWLGTPGLTYRAFGLRFRRGRSRDARRSTPAALDATTELV